MSAVAVVGQVTSKKIASLSTGVACTVSEFERAYVHDPSRG